MTYPVIGIRPIVDGRRGPMKLRESLEPQVWAMAEAAKKLFEENLCYSDGTPVKVVMCKKKKKRKCCNYSFGNTLLVLRCRDNGYGSYDYKRRLGL